MNAKDARRLTARGSMLAVQGQLDKAFADINRVLELEPRNVQALIERSVVHVKKKSQEMALADLNRALSIQPDDFQALFARSSVYMLMGRLYRALADCDKAVRVEPNDWRVHYCAAGVYYLIGRSDRAIAAFGEAIRVYPRCTMAYLQCGLMLMGQKQYSKAVADFSRFIELNAASPQGYRLCARAFRVLKMMRKRLLTRQWSRS